jgi:hypothetical protein
MLIKYQGFHNRIEVFINKVYCGNLEMKDDGFYDWYPNLRPGYIPSWVLKDIAAKLDDLNADWEKEIEKINTTANEWYAD